MRENNVRMVSWDAAREIQIEEHSIAHNLIVRAVVGAIMRKLQAKSHRTMSLIIPPSDMAIGISQVMNMPWGGLVDAIMEDTVNDFTIKSQVPKSSA